MDRGLTGIIQWIENAGRLSEPRKEDQDRLDACLCLLAALYLAEGKKCLMSGICIPATLSCRTPPSFMAILPHDARRLAMCRGSGCGCSAYDGERGQHGAISLRTCSAA